MAGRTIGTRVCSTLKELCKHGKMLVKVTLESSLVCSYIQNQSFKIKADEENLSYLKILYTKKIIKSKHETFIQCWFNVGPASTTLAQQ